MNADCLIPLGVGFVAGIAFTVVTIFYLVWRSEGRPVDDFWSGQP